MVSNNNIITLVHFFQFKYYVVYDTTFDVPRFNTNYTRNSVARRGAIVWNTLVPQLNDDINRQC